MPNIHILDQQLVNKIAAGEVVERPASAVKELVENSLDAGATDIRVDIENGGLDLIRIIDNGRGMDAADVKMSVRRYATSKIKNIQDLQTIATFGFRGEALAAISSVSNFRLLSRPLAAVSATELLIESGTPVIRVAGGAPGTTVEIRGLFNNVPARKKFLKVASTEFRHIAQVMTQVALMNPHVSWTLTHNSKDVLRLNAVTDWKHRVVAVLGKEISTDLLDLNHQRAALVISGFLSHPAKAKTGRPEQFIFVNRRPVQDFVLAKAVKQGYSHHIEPQRYPAFVLHISLPADLVDVNVHPRKSEVKFADPSGVFREVVHAVHEALEAVAHTVVDVKQSAIPVSPVIPASRRDPTVGGQAGISGSRGGDSPRLWRGGNDNDFDGPTPLQIRQDMDFPHSIAQMPQSDNIVIMSEPAVGQWKLLGQVHRCFLLVQSEDALLIVDQHAAAEKILYEKILAHAGKAKTQRLLIPLVVECSPSQFALAMEQKEVLAGLGIDVEEFGERTLRLSGVPQDLDVRDTKNFLFGILQDMQDEAFGKLPNLEDRQQRLAKYAACRGAVKFNDPLTRPEQLQLLADMQAFHVTACCHGRPVMKKLTIEQLRKEFHRP